MVFNCFKKFPITINFSFFTISSTVLGDKDSGLFSNKGEDHDYPDGGGGGGNKVENWATVPIGALPLPPGYNKLAIPLGNISDAIFVKVYLSIREVLDVDTKNGVSFSPLFNILEMSLFISIILDEFL